jgi:Na+-driven multidrug efflux pump
MTNITSYWLLAIPLAHYLAFNCGWGVRGLWWGIATANTVQAAVMGIIVARFDYEAEARAAAARFALRAPLLQPDGGEEQA